VLCRSFIGCIEGNLLVLLSFPTKKWGIAKISPAAAELSEEFDAPRVQKWSVSAMRDAIYSVELQLEYFFEKFKLAPSRVGFHLFHIERKAVQYHRLLRQRYGKLDEHFRDLVVSLL
jgi:hypothetical protein